MTMPSLSSRDRRALRLGAWVTLPVLFIVLMLQPFIGVVRSRQEEVIVTRELLARERGAMADAARDSARAVAIADVVAASAGRTFERGDAVAAAAELGGYARESAQRTRLVIEESETRAIDEHDAPPAVEIRARGDIVAIIAFLRALENGPKLTRVEVLAISRGLEGPAESRSMSMSATISGVRVRTPGLAHPTHGGGR